MKKITLTMGLCFILTACAGFSPAVPTATQSPPPTATETGTPTLTPTATSSPTPAFTATPTWVVQGPDAVQVPILLYHRIDISPINSRYYVPPEKFEAQIKLLHDWQYTPITFEQLVRAINEGATLPPRPVILTFDDGNIDNYSSAWPIMKKYGFTGVLYIVANYIGAENYMNRDQILEMYNDGWEVGSHSVSHFDLRGMEPEQQRFQIVGSRKMLEEQLGIPILTFAYPFGGVDSSSVDYVKFAGYIAGVGATGFTADQGTTNLFVLQRVEIKGSEDAKTFTRFLPWAGDPSFLPADTPTVTPTPSRTPAP